MFSVENADFIADKLASELLPNQEFREVLKNADEAIARRLKFSGSPSDGRIVFDVDWAMFEQTGDWYVCCADNGDGMTRSQLERYTTTLAVRGAGNSQGLAENQGMGLKISGPTRHKRGVLIRSYKDGEGWAVQVGHNGHEYGLIPVGPNGELIVKLDNTMFPSFIIDSGSGTMVTFLGNKENDNTFRPPNLNKNWLFKYAHLRFFRLSDPDSPEVLVRVPSGDENEWPQSAADASDRQNKVSPGPSFNLSRVKGTATVWSEAADKLGADYQDVAELPGDPPAGVPAARMHWWIFPTSGSDVSSRTAGGGSLAVLFQNELHDWRQGGQSNPYFGRLGVLYGKQRIGFILEPQGSTVFSDFARAHVLVGGIPVLESEAWLVWSDQFRANIPEPIKKTMVEEQSRIKEEDPERARRIMERLKDVMQQLRPRTFRKSGSGKLKAAGPEVDGPGDGTGPVITQGPGPNVPRPPKPKPGNTRGIGAVLTQIDDVGGESASEVFSMLKIEPKWVTESEADTFPIVNGNGNGLKDRAAAMAGEDAATAPILLLNLEFRGYQAILGAVNEWANPEGDDDKAALIEGFAQEWIEQKLVEAATGLRQLGNGSTWLPSNFDDALSPGSLTAAFMADRYHTMREVRRQAGAIRTTAKAAG